MNRQDYRSPAIKFARVERHGRIHNRPLLNSDATFSWPNKLTKGSNLTFDPFHPKSFIQIPRPA